MFWNIGWGNLLDVCEYSYKRPTFEFLSSVNLDHEILQFRMMNQTYQITEDEICELIGAPTENAFGPNEGVPDMSPSHFGSRLQCSGIVTYLAKSAPIDAFPDDTDDLELLAGTPNLNSKVYVACRLYRELDDGVTWLVGPDHNPQLTIDEENQHILDIADPITNTNWLLSNIIYSSSDDSEDEDYQPPPQNAGGDAPPPSYHEMYMNHFQTLNNNFQSLNQTYTTLNQNYETLNRNFYTMNERVNTYGERLDTYNTNLHSLDQRFATFESTYNSHYTQQQTQHTDLVTLITGFQNWTIAQPGFPPPPPPKNDQ
ncbi:hypothetical protein LXL04_003150 [Taraxacum kok-saghyz]